MTKYKIKPFVVEAEQYRDGLEDGFTCVAYGRMSLSECTFSCGNGKEYRDECRECNRAIPYIKTSNGKHYINYTDVVVITPKGEKQIYTKKLFDSTYELAE